MRKILIYCHEFFPINSGYSNAFFNLAKALVNQNSNVEVIIATPTSNAGQEIEYERIQVVRLDSPVKIPKVRYFLNPIFYAKQIEKVVNEKCIDDIIIETFDDFIFLGFLNKHIFKKAIVRIHSTSDTEYAMFFPGLIYKLRKLFIQNYISKKVEWIASTNQYHIDFAKQYYLKDNLYEISKKGFFVIPNTITGSKLPERTNNSKIKMTILGRMNYEGFLQKGFFDFAAALKLLDNSVLQKFDIQIIGDGPLKNKVKFLLEGVDNVTFVDKLTHEEVLELLVQTDVAVLPSRYEGLSMFALEALYSSCLCLFSNTGGLKDLACEEKNGFFFETQNIEMLASKIKVISELDSSKLEQMKKNSKEHFDNFFSERIVSQKCIQVLDIVKASQ
ncbi:glycosyltransferase family 4 protein [Catenovulum sediminis]|uniref:Glycosyltransferase family 4 protein n=1 Tax=Catenovulum sediminis TaxID=1740262 RepID=A0ABV1RK21_9ALTE